jgi:hypothetical protein
MSINPIERWSLAISAGAVVTSFALVSPGFAVGVGVGAALEAFNFRGLLHSSQLLFAGMLPNQRAWTAGFALRFGVLAVGIGAALYFGANAAGLLVGLSLIMPAVVIEALRNRPPVVTDVPALSPDDSSWELWNPWLAREELECDPSEGDDW